MKMKLQTIDSIQLMSNLIEKGFGKYIVQDKIK